MFEKTGEIPKIPKGIVKPTIVAGVTALGRGQDRESLGQFLTTISQTMGPEATQQYINPEEVIKRLAAAQGIDILNLVRGMQEVQQEQQAAVQQEQQVDLAKAEMASQMMDPSKNPALGGQQRGEGQAVPPTEG